MTYGSEVGCPWDPAISSERPELSASSSQLTDKCSPECQDDRQNHHDRASLALCRVVEDNHERCKRSLSSNSIDISDAENECNGHDEGQDCVRAESCHERDWNGFGGIFRVLGCGEVSMSCISGW